MLGSIEEPTSALNSHEIIPDLRIVPTSSLVPHEEHDGQRSDPLVQRIREAGSWLNPPVVAQMEDGRYVILDGANRHYALTELGYDYILVQVVDYENGTVQLETWHHVVSGMAEADLVQSIQEIDGLSTQKTDLLSARAALARREILAYAVLEKGVVYLLQARTSSLADRTATLRRIVDTYKVRGTLNRISTDSLAAARNLYPAAMAIIVFPHYEPAEIVVAARDGIHLPPGISRHIIRGRAMRLNYPLEALRAGSESLEEKNLQLQRWIQERMAQKRVRYYAEPTFLFDE